MRRLFLTGVFAVFSVLLFAQESGGTNETPDQNHREIIPAYRMNIKGDFKLPTPIRNKAFAKTIDGIADASISFNYPFLKYFHGAVGFRYSYFQINDLKINAKTNANLQIYSPFVKLAYERYANSVFLYGLSLKAGYSYLNYYSSTCQQCDSTKTCMPRQQAFMIEPELSLTMMANDNLAFSFLLGYTVIFDHYSASNVCLSNFSGLTAKDSQGYYQYFCAGFGFTAFLGAEKNSKRR